MIQTEVDGSERTKKFSFRTLASRFKLSKPSTDKDPRPSVKKKFSFRKFFRRKQKQPEVEFNSGYGELWLAATVHTFPPELSQLDVHCAAKFYRFNKITLVCPERRKKPVRRSHWRFVVD